MLQPSDTSPTIDDLDTTAQGLPADLVEAYRAPPAHWHACLDDVDLDLQVLCRPLLDRALRGLAADLGEDSYRSFSVQGALSALLPSLLARVQSATQRTAVLEMHVARARGCLQGDSPQARYASYRQRLADPEQALALFAEYPRLATGLLALCAQWRRASSELLQRLEADYADLIEHFAIGIAPGPLVRLADGSGDTHADGRRVQILEFASGLRVVYKPRPMELDVEFQQVIDWANAHAGDLDLRTPRVLPREGYGWAEYVAHAACDDLAQFARYYYRLGGLLAILYALQATDFHHENIIAAGEHPLAVDLETLLHPMLAGKGLGNQRYSVLDIALLPENGADGNRIDLSALGARRELRVKGRGWINLQTDSLQIGDKEYGLKAVHSVPGGDLEGAAIDHHEESFCAGFRRAYLAIARHRDDWLREGGLLDRLATPPARCVIQNTRLYQKCLWNSWHPDSLRDAGARPRNWTGLAAASRHQPALARVLEHEEADLARGDYPLFRCRGNSRSLWSSLGTEIGDILPHPPVAGARARVAAFSETTLATQLWMIRQTIKRQRIAQAAAPCERTRPHPPSASTRTKPMVRPPQALASEIAHHLADLAVDSGVGLTWAGLRGSPEERASCFRYLDGDLYSGQLGMIWFFAQAARSTGETRFRDVAERASAHFLDGHFAQQREHGGIGAFDGMAGVVHVYALLDRLWPGCGYRPLVDETLDLLLPRVAGDERYDVISGAAGCALVALADHAHSGSPAALRLAIACGEALLAALAADQRALDPRHGAEGLLGYSHGLAGIAHALARLSRASGDERYRHAAVECARREDRHRDARSGNWPDLRRTSTGEPPPSPWAWCHGAPGIAASRAVEPTVMDTVALAAIPAAVAGTFANAALDRSGLCHGAFGNLDLLRSIAVATADVALRQRCDEAMASAVASLQVDGSLLPWLAEDGRVDLMRGAAGVAYALLRQADDTLPSLLLVE